MTDLYIALQHREIRAHTKLYTPYVCRTIKILYQNISNHTIHYISVNKCQNLDTGCELFKTFSMDNTIPLFRHV
jgi:hypothetical protein